MQTEVSAGMWAAMRWERSRSEALPRWRWESEGVAQQVTCVARTMGGRG